MIVITDYGHMKAFFAAQIQIPIPCGYKSLFFCRINGCIMKNMDKGLTVPKWMLIVWTKITPNALEFICPSTKVQAFNDKKLHWASVVHDCLFLFLTEEA